MSGGEDMNAGEGARGRKVDPVEAFERLRAADPVDAARLPDTTDPRARILFEEITMSTPTAPIKPSTPRRAVLVGAAAVTVVIAAVAAGILGGWFTSPEAPPVAEGPDDTAVDPGSGGMAMCAEVYSLETLAARDFAFDGTVTAIDGDDVTFEVNEVFAGDVGDTVTLGGASSVTGDPNLSSAGGPGLGVGDRALVAGDDTFAWGCGFTQDYDAAVADQWRQTLG